MAPAINPSQYANIGFVKEWTFATQTTVTKFPGAETWSPTPRNALIWRNDTRNRKGRSAPVVGPYDFTASLAPAPQPDVLFPLLAYAMGAQATPSPVIPISTATTSSTTAGAGTVIPVTAGTGTQIPVGSSVSLDNGGNQETVTTTANSANSITATTTKAHASGIVVSVLSVSAFASSISFGTVLPSMTVEYVLVPGSDARDYLGVTIDTVKLSGAPGQDLKADFGLVAANEIIQTSPATPSFPTTLPLSYESTLFGPGIQYKGAALGPLLMGWDITLNNKLDKSFRGAGSRFVAGFPIGQREVSGSIKLSYSGPQQYKDFLGATGATGPQSAIAGISLAIPIASQSIIDSIFGIPYQLTIVLPGVYIDGDPIPLKNGALMQTLSFQGAEVSGGDDLSLAIISAASSVY